MLGSPILARNLNTLMIKAIFIFILLAAPAAAEPRVPAPPSDLAEAGRDIPPAEWRARVDGRTVWYYTGNGLWGREHYHSGAGYVTFQYWTGECRQARWSFEDGIYCFDFRDAAPHCFRHIEHEGDIWALPVNGGAPQAVVHIDHTPLDCGPAPSS